MELKKVFREFSKKLNEIEVDLIKMQNSDEKKERIKKISESQERLKSEISGANERLNRERAEMSKLKGVDEEYDEARMEIQEISILI